MVRIPLTEQSHCAALMVRQAGDATEKRCLASPIQSDESDDLAGVCCEGNVIEHDVSQVSLAKTVYL